MVSIIRVEIKNWEEEPVSQSPQIGSWFQLMKIVWSLKKALERGLNPLRSGLGFNLQYVSEGAIGYSSLNPLRSGLGFNFNLEKNIKYLLSLNPLRSGLGFNAKDINLIMTLWRESQSPQIGSWFQ